MKLHALPLLLICAFATAAYTQLSHLLTVPGFHFDEAWQALYANRIANEKGFFPTYAMNAYTTPVLHYLLAAVFKVFGSTFPAMRVFFAAMNLSALTVFCAVLWKKHRVAAVWFAAFWALLPLSVHNHRFYVEVTGFHGFCFSLVVLGLSYWKRRPRASLALLFAGFVAGTYSHVLFLALLPAGLLVLGAFFKEELSRVRARRAGAALIVASAPIPMRMGLGMDRLEPVLFGLAIFAAGAWLFAGGKFSEKVWKKSLGYCPVVLRGIGWFSLPFLFAFVFLLWNGFWPYAQMTGDYPIWWLPINTLLFLYLFYRHRAGKRLTGDAEALAWQAFLAAFFFCSVIIFKQTSRYYTVPAILAIFWAALALEKLKKPKLVAALAAVFVAWNLYAFEIQYVARYESQGPSDREFKVGFFHDNARDFRPFQKVFAWLEARNCHRDLEWIEDDRFARQMEFLSLTAKARQGKCYWGRKHVCFLHDPPPVPGLKVLERKKEWGDLVLFERTSGGAQ